MSHHHPRPPRSVRPSSGPAHDRPPPPRRRTARAAAAVLAAVTALLATPLAAGCGRRPVPPADAMIPGGAGRGVRAHVVHVVDGDTVELEFGAGHRERARLLGIDTPETVKPDTPVECFGPEASARTKALLAPGTAVLVQRDAEARDRYGRLLVYLWRQADGLFVNRSLVADGYARTLSIAPNTAHRVDLAAAASAATANGSGLWRRCPAGARAGSPGP